MILSHKHQFIFIHGQKTAGSSITAALNPYLGPRDIQVGAWEHALANDGKINIQTAKILLLRLPKLLFLSMKETINARYPVSKFDKKTINGLISGWYKRKAGFFPEPGHATATQVQQYDPKAWDDYFKFSIVRNPWDHAVSYYYWNTRNVEAKYGSNISFNEFLRRFYDKGRPDPENIRPAYETNWEIYTIDDQIAVDYVVRFEDLSADLDHVAQRIGIPIDTSIKAKSNIRDKKKGLEEHYDAECMHLVEKIYEKEIEHFGYEPPF